MSYENTDRELDWDEQIQNDGPEYKMLPEGDYQFEVTKFERGRFDGSAKMGPCKMAILTLYIDGGAKGETTITHRLYLHTKCEGLLCAFFESIGQRKHGEPLRMNWERVIGSHGLAKVEIHQYTKNAGGEGECNQIKRFLPPPDETASTPATATWQQGAF